ncbi:hypothetical protein SNOG_01350 [Parastagonospora nodorum SN15]|uniref:Uncharacterized protein n=1 Tax=Phaeosphaeria nodorum (strain SN15 / ATCC MYA-4574 / FGSC 10173) TaxID=321614 RepID=Q0V3R4_PHANO|nr:hypothetical protein SNOG_01350 [Parastagonospora nodorum SN15]EAT90999.1 hypothetical protein SNOG_01350 [Parastagonospora nodorum SN15]
MLQPGPSYLMEAIAQLLSEVVLGTGWATTHYNSPSASQSSK